MFHVAHEDDAWDLGVLHRAGHVTGSAVSLGVPVALVEFFEMGRHDHKNLTDVRVETLALRWDVSED